VAEAIIPYYEPQIERQRVISVPELAYDVALIRQDRALEEAHLLPGTGFLVKDQIRLFYENLEKGMSFQDVIKQVEQDVQGFKTEYLVQQPVFPIVLDKGVVNGEERLVGPLYGDKPFSDAISSIEREGAVKQATQEIEARLLESPPGTLIVMTSPKGESGYQNKNGVLEAENELVIENGKADRIIYPDSQTYCYQVKDDGSIRGFTLKSDMNIFQNEELLRRLGVVPDKLVKHPKSMDRIRQAVLNYAVIDPSEGKTIEDVLGDIVDIKKTGVLYKDTNGNRRSANEARGLLRNPESLWTLDGTTKALVDRFKKYAWWGMLNNSVDSRDLEVALGDIILRLMHEINSGNTEIGMLRDVEEIIAGRAVYNAKETLGEMQKIPGCAGGGIIESVTPRESKTANSSEKRTLCCTCPFCKEEVEAVIKNGRIICPRTKECGKSAKWSD